MISIFEYLKNHIESTEETINEGCFYIVRIISNSILDYLQEIMPQNAIQKEI